MIEERAMSLIICRIALERCRDNTRVIKETAQGKKIPR